MDIARYHVIHETRYDYESPVSLSRQLLHLTPRDCPWQRCTAHEIVIAPTPGVDRVRVDSFGNPVRQFAIETPHGSLLVRAESRVEVQSRRLDAAAFAAPAWALAWESVRDRLAYGMLPVELEASVYLFESPYTRVKREFAAYAAPSFTPGRPLLDAVRDLMQRVFSEFSYDAEATTVATPVLTVLEQRRGVCQDFAHLMISCLRSLGLSARYASGYLLTRPPPGKPRLIGADASHAWLSVFCPDASGGIWVDFDPTNNVLPDREHITVAWGRDFGDVSPLRGVILGGDAHQPEVAVTVTPSEEA